MGRLRRAVESTGAHFALLVALLLSSSSAWSDRHCNCRILQIPNASAPAIKSPFIYQDAGENGTVVSKAATRAETHNMPAMRSSLRSAPGGARWRREALAFSAAFRGTAGTSQAARRP